MPFTNFAFGGETAALSAAMLWALASIYFERAGRLIGPVELNLVKGLVALVFLGATAALLGGAGGSLPAGPAWLLAISGLIGIGFGDTVFFKALEHLGPRRALLVGSITPAMTALIALAFLGERLSGQAWAGMLITIAGIAWVITERPGNGVEKARFPVQGVVYAALFALSQAGGAVLSRAALANTSISSLQSTLIRLAAGVAALLVWIAVRRMVLGRWMALPGARQAGLFSILATFLGTYLGMWLQQTAFKLSPAGIAQTLSSTSPLFILPIAAMHHDRPSLRAALGALAAVGGIVLLFLA